DMRPRNDARGPIAIPHPHVTHFQLEQQIRGVRNAVNFQLIAQIGRLVGDDAIAENRKDVCVLLLEPQLKLCVVLVQVLSACHDKHPLPSVTGAEPRATRPTCKLPLSYSERCSRERSNITVARATACGM